MASTEQGTRYREIKRLGAGGMATVTLAEDTVLGRPVALKRVYRTGDRRNMMRLKREAMVGASLNHPNLVFVYDAQLQADGDVVIVMEYVDGETLADRLRSGGALPRDEARRVLRGVAAALDAIHDRGIVHRDVKPANVLLGRDGTVKLADLGVADVADRTRITTPDALVGSFSYMAPEQLDGARPSRAMDVYALAALAYEMLAGEKARPESNPLALAHAIATQPPPDVRRAWPAASAETAAVLQRGMSADPARRPTSAGEFVRRLEASLAPEQATREVLRSRDPTPVVAAATPAPPPPAARPRRRRSLLAPALLGLVALAVAGVIVATLSSGGGGGKPSASGTSNSSGTTHRPPARTSKGSARTAGSASSAGTATGTKATTRTNASTGANATAGANGTAGTNGTAGSNATAGTNSTAGTNATAGTSGTSGTGAATGANPATAAPASGAPASAVEQFYEAAARHQYSTAWALADSNLRSQLGGYSSFQYQMSSVRSITFHSARVLSGSSSSAATVALSTTSVQTNRTQQCSGTARVVRSSTAWLVDRVSISCS